MKVRSSQLEVPRLKHKSWKLNVQGPTMNVQGSTLEVQLPTLKVQNSKLEAQSSTLGDQSSKFEVQSSTFKAHRWEFMAQSWKFKVGRWQLKVRSAKFKAQSDKTRQYKKGRGKAKNVSTEVVLPQRRGLKNLGLKALLSKCLWPGELTRRSWSRTLFGAENCPAKLSIESCLAPSPKAWRG